MKAIEQAFFRIRQSDTQRTAELLAASPHAQKVELDEIADWFSESPETMVIRFDLSPLFFQPLPLGNYVIGLIFPDEPDFPSLFRAPSSFFVHCLLVSAETLLAAANHPISLYEKLRLGNLLPCFDHPPTSRDLETIPAVSPDELLNTNQLRCCFDHVNPMAFVSVIQSLFDSVSTIFQATPALSARQFLSALFDFFPILERTELTFSTAFFFSSRNPLRIIAGGTPGGDPQFTLAKLLQLPFFSFDKTQQRQPAEENILLLEPWPQLVCRVIKTKSYDFWSKSLQSEWTALTDSWGFLSQNNNDIPYADWSNLHKKAALWSMFLENNEPVPAGWNEKGLVPFDSTQNGSSLEMQRCIASLERAIALQKEHHDKVASLENLLQHGKNLLWQQHENEKSPLADAKQNRASTFRCETQTLDMLFTRVLFGDSQATVMLQKHWSHFCAQAPKETREQMREHYLDLLRQILTLSSDDEPRDPERNVQILELMVLFLEKNDL